MLQLSELTTAGLSIPPVVEREGRFWVVRDDQIPGGTKARALLSILRRLDVTSAVYAADPYGFGPIALATATFVLGIQATVIFPRLEKINIIYDEIIKFPNVKVIIEDGYLTQNAVYLFAKEYSAAEGSYLFPIGFDNAGFIDAITEAAKSIEFIPKEVWSIAGSGCLTRALQHAWPESDFNVVTMGFPHVKVGNARVFTPKEKANEPARTPPPFPSARYYDAKVWDVISVHGSDDALLWNVA